MIAFLLDNQIPMMSVLEPRKDHPYCECRKFFQPGKDAVTFLGMAQKGMNNTRNGTSSTFESQTISVRIVSPEFVD